MILGSALTTVVMALAIAGNGPAPAGSLVRLQANIANAIAAARPSVVDIRARRTPPGGWTYESAGAGIIVDPRGLVLTNEHLVGGAQQINVRVWPSGRDAYLARIVASDQGQDLALLELSGQGPFPTAVLASAGPPQEGERVVAIGTPLGLPHSASLGIVSHPQRTVSVGERTYPDMIQTDATVNQGNSGGPLLDLQGTVVGLVTAIFAPEGVSTGVAFAIPADRLRPFVVQSSSAAGLRLAAFTLEAIRIGQTRPHPFTGACQKCHTIRTKLAISMAQDLPHPSAGDCTVCHTFTDVPGGGVVTPDTATGNSNAPAGSASGGALLVAFDPSANRKAPGSSGPSRLSIAIGAFALFLAGLGIWRWRGMGSARP